jgi:hypothetical protein
MKKQLRLTSVIHRARRFGAALAAIVLLAASFSTASAGVIPPASLPYGLSYQEWSAKWWQWTLEQSTNHLENVGDSGICREPASHVKFLAGIYVPGTGGISVETRKITIPCETPLFFPILSVWVDNSGCPAFSSFGADALAAQAEADWSAVTVTTCTVDGVPVADLSNPATTPYLVQASPFSYTTAEKDNILAGLFGEPCIPGGLTIYPAVADGVYLMLSPLPYGKHSIHFVGVVGPPSAPFVKDDITYEITVE